jgi:hypothetical protein
MAYTVTNDDVQALVQDASVDATPSITTAHIIVSEELASAGYSDDRLKQIEIYLAAHFFVLATERGGITREVIGEAEERYRMTPDTLYGFASTRFGEQALALDKSGILAAMGATKGIKARFTVV